MLQLTRNRKPDRVVGVDIEAGSVAAAEVSVNGAVEVTGAAVEPLPPGAFSEGEVADAAEVAEALRALFEENRLSKRVRLGIGNQGVVVRTLRLPAIEDRKEMDAAIRFQAQEQIPMPLEEAVLDHRVAGGVPPGEGEGPQVEVVVVAARREMIHTFLEPARRAGLEPVGIDLTAFGMIRALAGALPAGGASDEEPAEGAAASQPDGAPAETAEEPSRPAGEPSRAEPEPPQPQPGDAVLYCNLGETMNLAVARERGCLFTRVATGLGGVSDRLGSERGMPAEQATQWLLHVGLDAPVETIAGDGQTVVDARRTLEEGVFGLVDEMRLSLDYYGALEGAVRVGQVVLTGPGSAIPGLAERMKAGIGLRVSVARPAALAALPAGEAARLTVPYGLALED